ncbi:MAG TPA: superoxide dismutase family protein [Casimicrobiaceae bacterium]|nr:superoxide dismutase family protein [Casimicrobiaceae bacterium]
MSPNSRGGPVAAPLRRARFTGAALVAALAIAGCATSKEPRPAPDSPPSAAASAASLGQVAALRAIGGSAVTGKVRVVDRGDGAMVTVAAFNLPIGEFRVAIQQTPNCTSPNGFSAGPAWAPPASKRKAVDLLPTLTAGENGSAQASVQVAGLRATGVNGVAGRSVVIYAGRMVTDARPDVRNERIACGVFEPARTLEF